MGKYDGADLRLMKWSRGPVSGYAACGQDDPSRVGQPPPGGSKGTAPGSAPQRGREVEAERCDCGVEVPTPAPGPRQRSGGAQLCFDVVWTHDPLYTVPKCCGSQAEMEPEAQRLSWWQAAQHQFSEVGRASATGQGMGAGETEAGPWRGADTWLGLRS